MKPTVYTMLGLTGSGKTTFAHNLGKELSLDVLSLDSEYVHQGGDLNNHKWNEKTASQASEVIKAKVREHIQKDESVVLDFWPWSKKERAEYLAFIKSLGAKGHVYYFNLSTEDLWERLESRNDGQVVTREMLRDFMQRFEPPIDEEVERILAQ